MTQFNPLVSAIVPSAQAQRQQSTERVGHVRRTQESQKNAAHQSGDTFEHQVESSDALGHVHDQDQRSQGREQRHPRRSDRNESDNRDGRPDDEGDEHPRLDLTA